MKQRTRSTINALILTAALNNEFGITKARLARELVLTYSKVNKHCEELVEKRLLVVSNKWREAYLGSNNDVIKSAQEIRNGAVESRYYWNLDQGRILMSVIVAQVMKQLAEHSWNFVVTWSYIR